MRTACKIMLDEREHTTLEKWSNGRMTPMRVTLRAKIV